MALPAPYAARPASALELAWRDPADAFAPLAGDAYALLLASGAFGRYSVIAADPVEVFEGRGLAPWRAARRALAAEEPAPASGAPFAGGLAGLLSYEFAAALEPVPRAGRSPWPDVALGLYRAAAVFDHAARRVFVRGAAPAAARLAARL
ncbi:MAG: hypothetical protein MI723_01970, partial [Caulobacterales bacterium]|nr:hypothetical protein [Caulobacterales bacterium]